MKDEKIIMINVTIQSFAEKMQIPVKRLIQKFADAGIKKTPLDTISKEEKKILLDYINRNNNIFTKELSLKKKIHSTLNISRIGEPNKLIHIEVRKKKYLKYDAFLITKNKKNKLNNLKSSENACISDLNSRQKVHHVLLNQKEIILKTDQNKNEKFINHQEQHTLEKNKSNLNHCNIKKSQQSEISAIKKEKNINIRTSYNAFIKETSQKKTNKKNLLKNKNVKKEKNRYTDNLHLIRQDNEKYIKRKQNSRLYEINPTEQIKTIEKKSCNKTKFSTLSHGFNKPTKKLLRSITIGKNISVSELASKMAIKSSKIIKNMIKLGISKSIHENITQDVAQLIAEDMGHRVKLIRENALEESLMLLNHSNSTTQVLPRAPIVTVMGHVDHGKTSLLDYIRTSSVSLQESGGITQHIGAYLVQTKNGNITFLDTPGHAAFTAMRARGVQITDIVILVVAADDSVMPQTVEAIQHAKNAQVPIIIAINKIDKNTSDPLKVKKALMQHGIVPEEYGGENQCILVSAKTGKGIDLLLEAILLQAEILELKADYSGNAYGVVIESRLDKGKGPIAAILINSGKLNRGDTILCGCEYGRVRAIKDSFGNSISSAGPSTPIEIIGLSGVPIAGDTTTVLKDEKKAREIAIHRQNKLRESKLKNNKIQHTQNAFFNTNLINKKIYNIVLKSDAQGTLQAILDALQNLSHDKIKIKIIGSGVGSITETDVVLSKASNAILIGFNVRVDILATKIIESENLNIKLFSIIYELINYVKDKINLENSTKSCKKINSILEVKHIFQLPKYGTIAGCIVKEGIIKKHHKVKILRNGILICKSQICSLRRFKENVNEVKSGIECGIGIKNFHTFNLLDIIESIE